MFSVFIFWCLVIIYMGDTLDEVRERMRKKSHEEKARLARMAIEEYARRRARQSNQGS